MPSPSDILAGLTQIANRGLPLAVIWHLAIAAALTALVLGWRPSQRTALLLAVAPLASVGVMALLFGNPFNGTMFMLAFLILGALALRAGRTAVAAAPTWALVAGAATLAFGWVYPHFTDTLPLAFLYAAPVGLVPCPTLAVVIGFTLLGAGQGARAWTLTLTAFGLFYAVFGVLRLGVVLDVGLLFAALALLVSGLQKPAEHLPHHPLPA